MQIGRLVPFAAAAVDAQSPTFVPDANNGPSLAARALDYTAYLVQAAEWMKLTSGYEALGDWLSRPGQYHLVTRLLHECVDVAQPPFVHPQHVWSAPPLCEGQRMLATVPTTHLTAALPPPVHRVAVQDGVTDHQVAAVLATWLRLKFGQPGARNPDCALITGYYDTCDPKLTALPVVRNAQLMPLVPNVTTSLRQQIPAWINHNATVESMTREELVGVPQQAVAASMPGFVHALCHGPVREGVVRYVVKDTPPHKEPVFTELREDGPGDERFNFGLHQEFETFDDALTAIQQAGAKSPTVQLRYVYVLHGSVAELEHAASKGATSELCAGVVRVGLRRGPQPRWQQVPFSQLPLMTEVASRPGVQPWSRFWRNVY